MGKIEPGALLDWPKTKDLAPSIVDAGVDELIRLWRRESSRQDNDSLWGDEIEYQIVRYDEAQRAARLSLDAARVLEKMADSISAEKVDAGPVDPLPHFHPQGCTFALESTPTQPFGLDLEDLLAVEADMNARRAMVKRYMHANDALVSVPTFPRLGASPLGSSITPSFPLEDSLHPSHFLPEETIGPQMRHITAHANSIERRERQVEMHAPIFRDECTLNPFHDPTITYDYASYGGGMDPYSGFPKANHIFMDSLAFGPGSCGLQVTMQCKNMDEARYMHDQLIPLGPLMLALTAGTPAYKGFLAATDTRWSVLSAALDDRSPEERGARPLQGTQQRLRTRRFSHNPTYISSSQRLDPRYQDKDCPIDHQTKHKLIAEGIDEVMATHFAHLFLRGPLIASVDDWFHLKPDAALDDAHAINPILSDANRADAVKESSSPRTPGDKKRMYATAFAKTPADCGCHGVSPADSGYSEYFESTEFFERINTVNWQLVRFKPPAAPPARAGWRVEFRAMEVQLTDFENAAFSIWTVLLARAILRYDVNLYVPIARVAENMERAHAMDAARDARLHFRKHIFGAGRPARTRQQLADECEPKSVDEIVNGSRDGAFPGLGSLVRRYVDERYADAGPAARKRLGEYMDLVEGRASGRVETLARWMRGFVREHPGYRKDSVVGERIGWDLMVKLREITESGGRGDAAPSFCQAAS